MSRNEKYYKIYNILKQLGFKTSLVGTKLLIKVILKASSYNDDYYYDLNDIYLIISHEQKDVSFDDIKFTIFYSINNRKKDISKRNFKNIFGFEYDEYYFTSKELVEIIVGIL